MHTLHPELYLKLDLLCGIRNKNARPGHYGIHKTAVLFQHRTFEDFPNDEPLFELAQIRSTGTCLNIQSLFLDLLLSPSPPGEQKWCD